MMDRRCVLAGGLSLVASSALGQGFGPSSPGFIPIPPWAYIDRPISPEDDSRLIVRFSGAREEFQMAIGDSMGRLLGLGIGRDDKGNTARLVARILEQRRPEESGVEHAAWALSSQVRYGRFMTTHTRLNETLSALTGVIVAPRAMDGWSLVWTPGLSFDVATPVITLGSGQWPQLEKMVVDMMGADKMVQSIQSTEVDRLLERGLWQYHTQTVGGSGLGTLRILRM